MDGYRLCHQIRTNDRLRNLPIVIYTATYDSPSDEELALKLGADKYLRKPASFETIHLAMREAILMQHATPRPEAWQEVELLNEYSDRIVFKLEQRNIELTQAKQRLTIIDSAKNEFLDVISHEFRTPLAGLITVSELILDGVCSPEENSELRKMFERSRRRILSILDDALLLTRMDVTKEQFGSNPVSLSAILVLAIEGATGFAESRRVSFAKPSTNLGLVVGDQELLVRAFQTLLETAVKFSDEGETVRLAQEVVAGSLAVTIESRGRTIPAIALPKFFEIFSVEETLTTGGDLGLGPPVAHCILSLLGASVSVANRDSSGIRLTISLRKADERPSQNVSAIEAAF
jgi:K+-sensing histidine kinase KdpD